MRPGLEISLLAISGRLIQAQCCWKCGQCRPTLFCESADMPEEIVADWSLRFPRSAMANCPESHDQCG